MRGDPDLVIFLDIGYVYLILYVLVTTSMTTNVYFSIIFRMFKTTSNWSILSV